MNSLTMYVNKNGFTWDSGNRFIGSIVFQNNEPVYTGGHIYETKQKKAAPFYNPNTGEVKNGWSVEVQPEEIKRFNISDWSIVGDWCKELHQFLLGSPMAKPSWYGESLQARFGTWQEHLKTIMLNETPN